MIDREVFRALLTRLEAGEPAVLLALAASRGSAPGRIGSVMAVGAQGPLAGTVGGGVAEIAVVERARAELAAGSTQAQLLRMVHRRGVQDASGMVCGGEHAVALAPLRPDRAAEVGAVVERLGGGGRCAWEVSAAAGWALADPAAPAAPRARLREYQHGWELAVTSGPSHRVYIVGGGHVSLALTQVLVPLDFRVSVVEEREVATFTGNEWSHERIARPFEELGDIIPAGEDVLVAIMTLGFDRDAAALDALAGKRFGYLGLLGSRAKVARILAGRPRPAGLRAPMGVPIGSQSPQEVAVSVAAELVAVRAGVRLPTVPAAGTPPPPPT